MKTLTVILVCVAIAVYGVLCTAIYYSQASLIFPSQLSQPVFANWKPTLGNASEEVLLDGRCGKLHAVIWKNTDTKNMLMYFHGNAESIASVQSLVPALLQLGYGVMAWDYPGYGRSLACRFSEDDLLQDADLAYRWLASRGLQKNMVIFGSSVGSGLALYVASRHPGHPVLLIAPYDALVNVASDHMPFFIPVRLLMRYPLRAEQWIGRIDAPVHVIHGLADTIISPERARALLRHAKANASVEWVENADHDDAILIEKSFRWLAEYRNSNPGSLNNE